MALPAFDHVLQEANRARRDARASNDLDELRGAVERLAEAVEKLVTAVKDKERINKRK
jgi:hypothetical protein